MGEANEPITAYGLMFGAPVPCTIAEVDHVFRALPDRTLFQVAGLGTVLGTAFNMAFGSSDMRTRAVAATAFGPIALELDSRGHQFPFRDGEIIAAFEEWLRAMAINGPEIAAIPTRRLAFMGIAIHEAAAWLGSEADPEVTIRLQQAAAAVDAVRNDRGDTPSKLLVDASSPQLRKIVRRDVTQTPIRIFVAYSHKDDEHRENLMRHISPLRQRGTIAEWHDRRIVAGQEWEHAIDEHLEKAQIILLLVSPDFLYSDYCRKEMARALERHQTDEAVVIPIVVRDTYMKDQAFAKLQMLPTDAKPVANWVNSDNAWVNVVHGIDTAIDNLPNR